VTPVVHLRRSCTDEQSEVALAEAQGSATDAAVTGVFAPGTYTVLADTRENDAPGSYALRAELAPLAGDGVTGDGCGDAVPLGAASIVPGDTFDARDDVSGSCAAGGAADVVYRLDVPRRSRLVAHLEAEEAQHVLALWSRCGDRSAEMACGQRIDEVLAPGTYFVGVDGVAPQDLGRFSLAWGLQDMSLQAAACASAPALVNGRHLDGSTAAAQDRFSPVCAGSTDATSTGPDRVFRFSLSSRSAVHLSVTASFDAVLELRRACADVAGSAGVLACEGSSDASHHATLDRSLEAGSYWVVVDGQTPSDEGGFTLDYKAVVTAR
jgi:hypothetical protein